MYAEELKQKPVSPLAGALITLACVFGLLLLSFIVSFLQYWLQIVWPQFVMYAIVVVAVVFAVRKYFTEYIYLIEKDRITFGRRIGKREKELLSVPLREVIRTTPYDRETLTAEDKKRYRFTFKKPSTWTMIICTGCVILVTCTPEYIEHLRNRRRPAEKCTDGQTN